MKIHTFQSKGAHAQMEDRILLGKNVLVSGYHFEEAIGSIFAVFDGVGGVTGSAYASSLAAGSFANLPLPATPDNIRATLNNIHQTLVNGTKTATTATGLVFGEPGRVFLFHVGNTRLSGLQNKYISQITFDQTQYASMLQSGMQESEIPANTKCVLTSCVGGRAEMLSGLSITDVSTIIQSYDKLMISSDGVHDYLSEDDMEDFLKKESNPDTLREMALKCRANGSDDDISILIIEK